MVEKERQVQVIKAISACENVLGLVASPALFAQWRQRNPPSVVRQTLLSALDNLLNLLASLRTQPIQGPTLFHSPSLLNTEPALRELHQLIEAWDPATTPGETLTLRAQAYVGDSAPQGYGSLSVWPDTGEPVNPSASAAMDQEMAEIDAAYKRK